MLDLQNSKRFQDEYKFYQSKINLMNNASARNKADALLKNLINEVRKINSNYLEMHSGAALHEAADTVKNNMIELRIQLNKLIKDSN